jgi:Flp pilus assembly protein TadD
LSGLFFFGSILTYLRFNESRHLSYYCLSLALFVAGLMSKSVIATLPVMLVVIFWWKQGNLSLKRDVVALLPFLAFGAGFGMFTAWVEGNLIGAQGPEFNYTIIERGLIAGRAIWFYLSKLFWPAELIFVYPRWQISQTVWWQYLFPAGVMVLLAIAICLARRWRGPLAGLLIFIGTLFPVLGFLNVYPFRYSLVSDHFVYLASLGVIVPVSAGLALFAERHLQSGVRYFSFVLLPALLVLLTAKQSRMFTDVETLWKATLERNPVAWMAHDNLGAQLLRKGDVDEAIEHFRKAVEINAGDAESQANLGNALLQLNQTDEAITHYERALQIKPNYAEVHYNLANALLKSAQISEAITHYQISLQMKPNDVDAQNNLGVALLQEGRVDEAITSYEMALELQPKNTRAQANLAWALAISTEKSPVKGAIAVSLARQAIGLSGGENPTLLRILAASYAQARRFSDAVETAQRALELAAGQNNSVLADTLRAEIELYQNNQPCRIANH